MRAGVMNLGALSILNLAKEGGGEEERSGENAPALVRRWNPEDFAREQVQGLVRRVFFGGEARVLRQVMLCAVDLETDVGGICYQVGETLARETTASVAIVGTVSHEFANPEEDRPEIPSAQLKPLQRISTRVRKNLWLVPSCGIAEGDSISGRDSYLEEVRREFEYSIVQGPCGGPSHTTNPVSATSAGLILVLSAQRTRREAARRVKDLLEASGVVLLGTILSDRDFPMPEGIYRRL